MISGWWEASLSTLLSNYDLKDNYNGDEFGLFCECLQGKTYQVTYACDCEGQKVTGIQEREAFTLQSQKSTKMLDGWSIEWVTDGKKICFWMKKNCFSDWNCPAHPQIENLKSFKLFFSPTEHNFSGSANVPGCDSLV